jgi:hypothetical protein
MDTIDRNGLVAALELPATILARVPDRKRDYRHDF